MGEERTLIDVIERRSKFENKKVVFIKDRNEEVHVSYKELLSRSLQILYFFQSKGVKPDDEVVFQIEDIEDYIYTFWACLLGGIIPVTVTVGNNDEHKLKLYKVWRCLKNPYLIADEKQISYLEKYARNSEVNGEFEYIKSRTLFVKEIGDVDKKGDIQKRDSEDIAYIQFSSGSSGDPKGVILTHNNLMTNMRAIVNCTKASSGDSSLSWLPLTHDMGMIGLHLSPLMANINQFIMPTSLFIRYPILWFEKINEHRVTITASPNFGYKYFLTYFKHEVAKGWDLSNVRLILNGAEPISPELTEQFLNVMSDYHLKKISMCPAYGMAEASLAITLAPLTEEFNTVRVQRNSLVVGNKIMYADELAYSSTCATFVDLGYPVNDCLIRIVDEQDRMLGEHTLGNIQIKGKNVTKGYYNNSVITQETFTKDGWLRTGDLGFWRNKCLIVTGRAKDIIFINGYNYYPHDIERIAQQIEGIDLGKVVACGVFSNATQKEEIIVFVLFKNKIEEFVPIAVRLMAWINSQMGLQIKEVIPIKSIPKTTSGKVQRYKLAEKYLDGEFGEVEEMIQKLTLDFRNNRDIVLPNNEIEEIIYKICKEVFPSEHFGIKDNFIEMGANSILLTSIHKQIDAHFPGKVTVAQIFANPTIERLSKYLYEQGGTRTEEQKKINKEEIIDIIFDQVENGMLSVDEAINRLAE